MANNLFYHDLSLTQQAVVWGEVQRELLACGDVEPQEEDESDEDFERRLDEATDYYLNVNNFPVPYEI